MNRRHKDGTTDYISGLVLAFIFTGNFTGVGFLVAAKTIFRIGDLTKNNDMKLTEYMMLGTLMSFSIALIVGWGTLNLIHLFI